MEIIYEKILVLSEDLKPLQEFEIGGLLVQIDKVDTNSRDEKVLHLTIIGQTIKKRSKMMLVIPKKLPIETLQ